MTYKSDAPVVASCFEFRLFLRSTLAYLGSSLFNAHAGLSLASETTEICGEIIRLFLLSGGVGGGGSASERRGELKLSVGSCTSMIWAW